MPSIIASVNSALKLMLGSAMEPSTTRAGELTSGTTSSCTGAVFIVSKLLVKASSSSLVIYVCLASAVDAGSVVVGTRVGVVVGSVVGVFVGVSVGALVGATVGLTVGCLLGAVVGDGES